MLEDRRYGEAVRLLGSLLENPEDFFFKPNADEPVYRSLKAEAGRLIADMPAEGRESYELQFGARAAQMLKQAAAAGNLSDVAEVSRRFFYTRGRAGSDVSAGPTPPRSEPALGRGAVLRAAARDAQPAASDSNRCCRFRWPPAGCVPASPTRPRKRWCDLKRAAARGSACLAASRCPVRQRLAGAGLDGGQTSASSTGARGRSRAMDHVSRRRKPQRRQHRRPAAVERALAAAHGRRPHGREIRRQSATRLPEPGHRGAAELAPAGRRRRRGDADRVCACRPSISTTASWSGNIPRPTTRSSSSCKAGSSQQPRPARSSCSPGSTSGCGKTPSTARSAATAQQVYYVEDLGLAGVNFNVRYDRAAQRPSHAVGANSRGTNRLAARELRTQGKLKWEVGGLTGEDEPKLAGAFFLGPPLPLAGTSLRAGRDEGSGDSAGGPVGQNRRARVVATIGRRRAARRDCTMAFAAMPAPRPALPTACWFARRRPAPSWPST